MSRGTPCRAPAGVETAAKIHADINAAHRYRREAPGRDEWLTPAQFDAAGGGDCEDFAIAYWHALRGLPGRARVAWCLRNDREGHMVCLYCPPGAGDPLVLDVVADAVCPLSARPDLRVMFELDADGLYSRDGTRWPAQQVSAWVRLLVRMETQGEALCRALMTDTGRRVPIRRQGNEP